MSLHTDPRVWCTHFTVSEDTANLAFSNPGRVPSWPRASRTPCNTFHPRLFWDRPSPGCLVPPLQVSSLPSVGLLMYHVQIHVQLFLLLLAGRLGWTNLETGVQQDVFPFSPSCFCCFGPLHCPLPMVPVYPTLGDDPDPQPGLALAPSRGTSTWPGLLVLSPLVDTSVQLYEVTVPPCLLLTLSTASSSLQLTSATCQVVRLLGSNLMAAWLASFNLSSL